MTNKTTTKLHITEDHNEVLEHIYRAIGSKLLPFSGNALLHFDSHPDLLIPHNLLADDTFNKDKLFSTISIENWIMPALYAGHVSTVIWVKKEWATQIADGSYEFSVGKEKETENLRCSCTQPYFVSELLYCPPDRLTHRKDITLIVVTFQNTESIDNIVNKLTKVTENRELILDIDLDYFSTTNPFLDIYSTKQLKSLATLYHYDEEANPDTSAAKRSQQLQFLLGTMKSIAKRDCTSGGSSKDTDTIFAQDDRYKTVKELIDEEITTKGSVDAELLHEHGCTFDTTGLPHHISTSSEVDIFVSDMTELLRRLKINPKIITIARSSDDDYCPKSQVDLIQEKCVTSLRTLYQNISEKKHYL